MEGSEISMKISRDSEQFFIDHFQIIDEISSATLSLNIKKGEYIGTYDLDPQNDTTELYATTLYAYDPLGNLEYVRDALGNETWITYDSLSRKTAIYDPDMGLWEYEYDVVGNLITQIDAKDQVLRPEQFYRVYPRYQELLEIKHRLDPEGLFTSDLARRVGIDPSLDNPSS